MSGNPVNRFGTVSELTPTNGHIMAKLLSEWTFEIYPQLWATPEIEDAKGHNWTSLKFDPKTLEDDIGTIPTGPGVYQFIVQGRQDVLDQHSYIFYIGKAAKGLRARYREYIEECKAASPKEDRENIVRMLNYFMGNLYFTYTEVEKDKCAPIESALKDNFTPPANKILKLKGRIY